MQLPVLAPPFVRFATLENTRTFQGGPLSFLATAEDTDGRFALLEYTGKPGMEPPLHTHAHEDEVFYVLEGRLRVWAGDQTLDAPSGTLVFIPRGVEHTFEIAGEQARGLIVLTPAGLEGFFRELSTPATTLTPTVAPPRDGPAIARFMQTCRRYGITPSLPCPGHGEGATAGPVSPGAFCRRAERGNSYWRGRALLTVLAAAAETAGRSAAIELTARRGVEPPRHVHTREDELRYVLDGEVTVFVAGQTLRATPGACVYLPRGVEHTFRLESEVVRQLVLLTPAGFEAFFLEDAAPDLTPERG